MPTLNDVKATIGVTGTYQDATLKGYYDETIDFLRGAGVKEADMTVGVIARGVLDLWNYGAGDGKLSEYFMQRAAQLSYK